MGEKPKILLVDDEPSVVKMVGKRLELDGFQVLIAMDGHEALTRAQTESPDLIILDLMLPKRNGYEVCATLKQDARYRHIPIVLFTAKNQPQDETLGMACGADAYVKKPFNAPQLLEQVHGLLGRPRATGR